MDITAENLLDFYATPLGQRAGEALGQRIDGCESDFLITADEGLRGSKTIPLKANADKAIDISGRSVKCLVVKRTGGAVDWNR